MSAIYLDASAFVKLIVDEPESRAMHDFLAAQHGRFISSALLRTEAMRARLLTLRREDFWDPALGFGLLRGERFRSELERRFQALALARVR